MPRSVLYVDDEPDNIVVFEATFEDDFTVYTAGSAAEALEILDRVAVPVVVADQRMPEMTGVELFEVMRSRHPYTRRILLTGYSDSDALLDAINKGQIFYFLKKPWQRGELLSVLRRALEVHDLEVENNSLTEQLVMAERCALLGRASARIAHEIGNQLSMLPMLEVLEEDHRDDPHITRVVGYARQGYERLSGLVQEIKSFMRTDAEEISLRPLALHETVHELASFLRFDQSVPLERLTVELRADMVIHGHRAKLQQVLVNLIKNAAHAIRERSDGRIVLSVDRDGEAAVIQVTDNGCGMDDATKSRIWEPFFTTKGHEGTGLGLDVVRRLVETHHGTITCESEPGLGTTFTLRMPLAVAETTGAVNTF